MGRKLEERRREVTAALTGARLSLRFAWANREAGDASLADLRVTVENALDDLERELADAKRCERDARGGCAGGERAAIVPAFGVRNDGVAAAAGSVDSVRIQ
jgi:hypothetical protein